jgi:hypothetical protein
MKSSLFNPLKNTSIAIATLLFIGCSTDEDPIIEEPIQTIAERPITVAGALMGTNPGDGNGGTMVYTVTQEEAKNPETLINVYEEGFGVKSNRTARLQSSEDGETLFNIAYTGDNGGEFSKYAVLGGGNFVQSDVSVNISQYAGTSPRWAKLFDGDQTGIAVNVANIQANNASTGTTPDAAFEYYRGVATVLSLDLQNTLISNYKQYEIPLTEAEELEGHTVFRLDSPVLNAAKDKLIIGTWMRKYNVETGETESAWNRLGTKSVVVDYPSLENPRVITSTVGFGDSSGYRSFNAFVAADGSVYQATQRDPNGSHILRITPQNEYDNSYVFSLDQALGVEGVYIDSWRLVGTNKAYILYTHEGSSQGYVALVDLSAKTAVKVDLPYDEDLDFGQYQGFVVHEDEVFVAVTPVGKNGNIYILNSRTGAVTKGATLVNQPGNHYIGIF